ncbi:hypothetical protein [Spirosoma spitsbergense]|jgi:hypothetical protein|uniref:hypothetical protein n=1 Tax=Spirosoma spitsbergense TaxID=431554 RepID=UPI00037DCA95|nr:hypothetical protein [Spirosoma spitsbergense]
MKTTYLTLTLLTFSLACQTKPKQDESKEKTAVIDDSTTALSKRPGPDAPRTVPDRLVRALYFEHNKTENPFREKKNRALIDEFFAKPTADLIWNDAQKSTGKVNRAKTNLLYNAPDANIKKMWVEPAAIGGTRAIVYVTFLNKEKPEEVKIDMQQVAGRWGITEINYPNAQQLTKMLK